MMSNDSKVMLNGTLKRLIASSVISEENAIEAVITSKKGEFLSLPIWLKMIWHLLISWQVFLQQFMEFRYLMFR